MSIPNDLGASMPPGVAALMDKVRRQQAEVERIQRGIETMQVTGGSRDDEVRVTVRGNGQLTDVWIDPELPGRVDSYELGDLVKEAVNDGLRRVAEASSARFKPIIEAASNIEGYGG
jgi:DNA-binding YbaB/EbfC family protein